MAMNSRLDAAAYRLQADAVVEKRRQSRYVTGAVYAVLLGMVIWSIDVTVIQDTDWERMGSLGQVLESVNRFIGLDFDVFSDLLVPTIETLLIACFGTFLGLILCIPAAWFGAMNITPYKPVTYPIARLMMTLSRSIHEIVWALFFVSVVGLGAMAGVLAIAVRSVGFIAKMTALFNNKYMAERGFWTEWLTRDLEPAAGYMPGTTPYHVYFGIMETREALSNRGKKKLKSLRAGPRAFIYRLRRRASDMVKAVRYKLKSL